MMQAGDYTTRTLAHFSCPLRNGLCPSVEGQKAILSSVVGIVSMSCPTAVIGGIAFIVVYAVYVVAGTGTLAHVGNEIGKVKPSLAYSDPATTIVFVVASLGICASLFNVSPYAMLNSIRKSMLPVLITEEFSLQASAGIGLIGSQRVKKNGFFCAAITPTKPIACSMKGMSVVKADCYQSAESLSCDVNLDSILSRHAVHPPVMNGIAETQWSVTRTLLGRPALYHKSPVKMRLL